MRRETQNILLVLLGGALLKLGINGDYLRYVKPAQQPWVLAGGAVMLALGAIAIVRDVATARTRISSASNESAGDHHHPARSAWLLVLPVLAVYLIAPPALGSDSVTRTESRAPAPQLSAAFPPLPPGNVVPLSMTEFVTRAGWDGTGSLNGRTVSLTGFVTHHGNSVLLARMVITCCAADAFPVTVRLDGAEPAGYPDDTWLRVTGQVVPGTATRANRYTPDLTVTAFQRVPAPQDPYEE
ncbi:TIGR03943 family putative permease subunit [Amycolatopsis taiwanensis]|uniref:TIGR03943 family protein n=1 Tax=Amycolatopsis taiwanensis TaxID=342230 RepID=A0A9W6R651_9PSEU|nr:TIGR03943 family protein [Amycolatopsis taiwanensis]GLY69963.1 TIGR03943 family protein [Amycolatopsis taiwanensis]